VQASVDRTAVKVLVRDFRTRAAPRRRRGSRLAREVVAGVPGAVRRVHVEEQYRNMREVLEGHPSRGRERARGDPRAGLEVRERAIRGGTDGSRLSFMGLPTPNLFAGEQNFHSRLEWVSVQDMEKAVEVIVELAEGVGGAGVAHPSPLHPATASAAPASAPSAAAAACSSRIARWYTAAAITIALCRASSSMTRS
jgi:hypothetical protein